MKGKKLLPVLALFAFAVSSCNLSFPSKFEIKTKANYNFTIAKVDAKLSDYFNISDMIPTSADDPYKVYDYNPSTGNSEKVQQFMIRMPIQEIPIDFSSYLSSTDLGDALSSMSGIDESVDIPEMALSSPYTIESSSFNDAVNKVLSIKAATASSVEVTFEGGSFSKAYYKTGNFIIQSIGTPITGNVRLVTVDDSETVKETISSGTFTDGKAVLNINGKAIDGTYTRLIFDDNSGKTFGAGIDPASQCEKIIGLTVSSEYIDPLSMGGVIDTSSLGSQIDSAIFGDGCNLNIDYKLPSGWTGITIKQDVKLTGGITLTKTKADSLPYSLNGVEFTCTDINADISVYPEITNATIIFGNDIQVEAKVNVDTLKQVSMNCSISTDLNVEQFLPAEAVNMIQKVIWNPGTGIKVKYTNTFPAGNDFVISGVKSSFFKINEKTETLTAGSTDQEVLFVSDDKNESDISSNPKIDFTGKVILPGATAGKIIMKNIKAGENYKVKVDFEPVLNWEKIYINNGSTKTQQKIVVEFNKASIFSQIDTQLGTNFQNKLELTTMPVHLYCEVPNIESMFTDPGFNGIIEGYICNQSGDTVIRDTSKDAYAMELLNGKMNFDENTKEPVLKFDENKVQLTEMKGGLEGDFAPLINNAAEGQKICVDCDITFSTGAGGDAICVEKSKLAGMTSTTMKIVAVIILPLDVTSLENQTIDLLKIANKSSSEDLFGRTEEPNYERIVESMEFVEYVKVSFLPEAPFFISTNPITVDVDIDGTGTKYSEQSISMNGGSFLVEEPATLLQLYPLYPSAKITLPAGRIAIPRDAALKTPIRASVQTNGSWDLMKILGGE